MKNNMDLLCKKALGKAWSKVVSIMLCYLFVISMLVGCGTNLSQKTIQNNSSSQLVEKDSVVIAISSEPTSLDPCTGWGHGTTPLVQSTLVEYKQDMTFKNDLATKYELSSDGLIWTFHIRKDAYFTDGELLNASDVEFTFMTAKSTQASIDLTFLDKVEAVSDFTVKFILNKPTATFMNTIATMGIVPEHAYNSDYGRNPMGSGPYKFVQWNVGEQLILEANKNYYGDIPKIDKVSLVFMEEDAAFAAARSGQVDVALVSPSIVKNNTISDYRVEAIRTLDNRGFTLPMEPNKGLMTESGYPLGNDVTSNVSIRKALAYGIDREQIAKDAVYGYGDPAYSENDGMPWNNPEVRIVTERSYANKILLEDGWKRNDDGILEKDGRKAEFTCIYPSGDSLRQAIAMAAAQQAKEMGIHIIVEGTSWDDISKRMYTNAVLMGWGSSNPYTSYSLFHSDNKLKDDYYNPEGFDNQVVDDYLKNAMESLTIEDAYKYWKLAQWDGTTGTSMKGDCPWVWLVNIQHTYYVRNGLNIGEQQLHEHGASMTLIQNLKEWSWEK